MVVTDLTIRAMANPGALAKVVAAAAAVADDAHRLKGANVRLLLWRRSRAELLTLFDCSDYRARFEVGATLPKRALIGATVAPALEGWTLSAADGPATLKAEFAGAALARLPKGVLTSSPSVRDIDRLFDMLDAKALKLTLLAAV